MIYSRGINTGIPTSGNSAETHRHPAGDGSGPSSDATSLRRSGNDGIRADGSSLQLAVTGSPPTLICKEVGTEVFLKNVGSPNLTHSRYNLDKVTEFMLNKIVARLEVIAAVFTYLEHFHTDGFIRVNVGVAWHPVAVAPH